MDNMNASFCKTCTPASRLVHVLPVNEEEKCGIKEVSITPSNFFMKYQLKIMKYHRRLYVRLATCTAFYAHQVKYQRGAIVHAKDRHFGLENIYPQRAASSTSTRYEEEMARLLLPVRRRGWQIQTQNSKNKLASGSVL